VLATTVVEVLKQGVGFPIAAANCEELRVAPFVRATFPTYTPIMDVRSEQQSERDQSCTSVIVATEPRSTCIQGSTSTSLDSKPLGWTQFVICEAFWYCTALEGSAPGPQSDEAYAVLP